MAKAKKISPKNYLIAIVAALIVVALAVSSFINSFVRDSDEFPMVDVTFSENNTVSVNPNGSGLPDHAPNLEPPTIKPPTE
jgi:hypothetical protein